MQPHGTSKGQLAAITALLVTFILLAVMLYFTSSSQASDFAIMAVTLTLALDLVYVIKLFQLQLASEAKWRWLVVFLLMHFVAIPFSGCASSGKTDTSGGNYEPASFLTKRMFRAKPCHPVRFTADLLKTF